MLLTLLVVAATVVLCNAVHFYSLRQLAHIFRDIPPPVKRPMLFVSFAIMVIHLIEVGIYGLALWFLTKMGLGELSGMGMGSVERIEDFFYFSVASYTSLGIGDIVPHGHLRIIVGIEALQGLILIAWSASFSYLVMERFWSRGRQNVLDDI